MSDLDPDHAERWREAGRKSGLAGADLLKAMLSAAVPPSEAEPLVSLSLKIPKAWKDEWDALAYASKRKGPALLRAMMDALAALEGGKK